jgi:HEPN domain-containing protein
MILSYDDDFKNLVRECAFYLRDEADRDYISARHIYQLGVTQQFLWGSLQALEKYLKCIPLFLGTHLPNCLLKEHDLTELFHWVKEELLLREKHWPLAYPNWLPDYLAMLTEFGLDRYVLNEGYLFGNEVEELDEAVWCLRRYCRPSFVVDDFSPEQQEAVLANELREFIQSRPPGHISLFRGFLEEILRSKASDYIRTHREEAFKYGNICLDDKAILPFARSSSHDPFWKLDSVKLFIASDPIRIIEDLSKYIYLTDEQKSTIYRAYGPLPQPANPKKVRKIHSGITPETDWIIHYPVCGNEKSSKYGFYNSRFWKSLPDTKRKLFVTEKDAKDAGYCLAPNGN